LDKSYFSIRYSEEVEIVIGFFFHGFWEIGDFHVFLEAHFEVFELFGESFTFLGVLEGNKSSVEGLGLFVVECFLHLLVIKSIPFGFFEGFHLINDISDLVIDLLEILVVDVHTLLVVVDTGIELSENILDLGLHLLASGCGEEFLVESFEVLHLFGVGPSLGGGLSVSNWLALVDGIPDFLNISPFLGNFFLSCLGDGDFKEFLEIIIIRFFFEDLSSFLSFSALLFEEVENFFDFFIIGGGVFFLLLLDLLLLDLLLWSNGKFFLFIR